MSIETRPDTRTIVQKNFPSLAEGDGHPSSVGEFTLIVPGLRNAYSRKDAKHGISGVFRTVDNAIDREYFKHNPEARASLRRMIDYFKEHDKKHDQELVQHISDLDLVCTLLGVSNPSEIPTVITDERRKAELRGWINNKIATTFGFDGKPIEKAAKIASYAQAADRFVDSHLRAGILEPFSQRIDITEEVRGTDSIIDLLSIMFDPGYSERARFEAKRKLTLMQLAAELDMRDRQTEELNQRKAEKEKRQTGKQGDPFVRFLDAHVWKTEGLRANPDQIIIVSKHRADDYSCIGTEEVTEDQLPQIAKRIANNKPQKSGFYLRVTYLPQRSFEFGGEEIPASFFHRPKKDFLASMAKLLKKGKYNPEAGIEDMTGWMFVVRDKNDIISLKRHIEAAGRRSGSLAFAETTEDTSDGGIYSAENAGSSKNLHQLKYDALIEGRRIEIIILDYKNYLDYYNRDVEAHEEYELRRLVESGVFEGLFPKSIYGIGAEKVEELIQNLRTTRRHFNLY